METCPACGGPLLPFRAKLVCRTPGCGFMESCCDGGWMQPGGEPNCDRTLEAPAALPAGSPPPSLSDDPPSR